MGRCDFENFNLLIYITKLIKLEKKFLASEISRFQTRDLIHFMPVLTVPLHDLIQDMFRGMFHDLIHDMLHDLLDDLIHTPFMTC